VGQKHNEAGLKEIEEARRLLERYQSAGVVDRVADLQGRLAGCASVQIQPEARSVSAQVIRSRNKMSFSNAVSNWRARSNTTNVRIFDFWRLDNQVPYRDAIDRKLIDAAAKAGNAASPCFWKMSTLQYRDRRRSGANR